MLKWCFVLLACCYASASADELRVAVAANFAMPLIHISAEFETATGHRVVPIVGSTGSLYAQIRAGAPYHVFLAADQARPRALVEAKFAVAGTQATYAVGELVLWSASGSTSPDQLFTHAVKRIAIANPKLAPFGAAAAETLTKLDPDGALTYKLVYAQNVAQVHTLVASGSAQAGLIARSSLGPDDAFWPVPSGWHTPVRQDAVITTYGADTSAARAFLDYLTSEKTQKQIAALGYEATTAALPRNR